MRIDESVFSIGGYQPIEQNFLKIIHTIQLAVQDLHVGGGLRGQIDGSLSNLICRVSEMRFMNRNKYQKLPV